MIIDIKVNQRSDLNDEVVKRILKYHIVKPNGITCLVRFLYSTSLLSDFFFGNKSVLTSSLTILPEENNDNFVK